FSTEIFTNELLRLYNLEALSPVGFQYKDYSEWQHQRKRRKELESQKNYWLKEFSGEIPLIFLPLDYARPAIRGFEGNTLEVELPKKTSIGLKALAEAENVTVYMLLLAAYNILLAKLSGQEDIVVGTTMAGREHPELQHTIGMYVNTLAIRSFPGGEKRFNQFLSEIKTKTLAAFENQEYPFEELVDEVVPDRDNSRNPLFDCVFVLVTHETEKYRTADLEVNYSWYISDISKFDLTLSVEEYKEKLILQVEYRIKLFKQETIQRFIGYFRKILSCLQADAGQKISQVEIISDEEKEQILYRFNTIEPGYFADRTIHQLFAEQVERTPDHMALIGPNSKQKGTRGLAPLYITYKELNKKSNQSACILQAKGVQADTIVGIMMERSIEMIVGILGILKAGGAYLPIDPDYPQERINYMLSDSRSKILLTSHEKIVDCQLYSPLERGAPKGRGVSKPAENLAYIIYTSGTTGKPKGALIRHRNVVRLMSNNRFLFDFHSHDIWTMFHSLCFDFSVWEMYGALLYGAQLVIIPKMLARDIGKFLKVLKEKQVTVLNQTPTVFYNLIDEELKCPDRRLNLRWVIFGGESLKPGKLSKWKEKYPGTQLINMYGITETTVHVTFKAIQDRDIELNISNIGKPIPTLTVVVIDRNLRLLPAGVPGELCVGGDGVGRGYLNRPGLTAEKFIPNPYKPGDILYRSGDLVKFSENGEMEYLGRLDHQVKIRGFRIESGEIESQLLRHPGVKDAVVLAREDTRGDKHLCAYIVGVDTGEKKPGSDELVSYLLRTLPDYMIPAYFVPMKKLPLTANGKIDRKALPEPEANTGDSYTAPRNKIEMKLAELFSKLLGIQTEKIGIHTHFFRAGGHSLKAAQLTAKIHNAFQVIVPIIEVFKYPTIRELAEYISQSGEEEYIPIEAAEKKEYYALSSIQKRLFLVQQMEGIETAYNLAEPFIVEGQLNPQQLEQAFQLLIQRHESLRTSFHIVDDQPVQRIRKEVEFKIEYYKEGTRGLAPLSIPEARSSQPAADIISSFIRPFDLSEAPLLRVGLSQLAENKYLLVVDIHHIVSDGTSQTILYRDLFALYENRELPHLGIQYKDFSQWQRGAKRKKAIDKQGKYWQQRIGEKLPDSDIFTDFPRPPMQSFAGDRIDFAFKEEVAQKINRLAEETGTTLYMVLLAVYSILLSKYTGQEDIIVGTPVAGREHQDVENLIGVFINALPMRNYPKKELTFMQFLEEVKENTLNAFENQGYPFDYLLESLNIKVGINRNPIFDVELVLLNMEPQELAAKELTFISYEYEMNVTQVDLALYGIESEKGIEFSLFYSTSLFKRSTMERFIDYFKEILGVVVEDRNIKLKDIHISYSLEETKADIYNELEADLEF
ncbi:MAG: amino acid adenylation domain-containing protein, partial [Candidatus Aminicenantes bacterium]